ncbi:hypothetical protein J6590_102549 [Homalodisca vitripennis]|nr:hypothetical protein J6590_102444 [Homalodisca vitripennis]KAG8285191.1 hypothetical protein J6590_085914 [Homalodisca vitripennis]KAG8285195.1 hypothetical protein J6590_085918 [Homalodisca vitripennis]KAG8299469.1 hypothetical protein J6590_100525 [Homalodisca vitripennis]KAG8304096.1 hypothetical protein J6590_102549 [Homalodisca vitripennis]
MGQEDMPKEESPSGSEKNTESDTQLDVVEEQNLKRDYVRSRMEAMQKRIDKLKEKIKHEGDFLNKEEATIKSEIVFDQNIEDLQSTFGMDDLRSEDSSEKSLYFSASNYSICSVSSGSTDSAYSSFTRFVNNFVKTQGLKERASLLQLHSKKQISMNMMKHSLAELDSRCSDELEVVQRNLEHLERIADEFGMNLSPVGEQKALEFHGRHEPLKKQKVRNNLTVIWPPVKTDREKLELSQHSRAIENATYE